MRNFFLLLIFLSTIFSYAQKEADTIAGYASFIAPEIMLGKTAEANTHFPETNLQTNFLLNFGTSNLNSEKEWAYRLNYPKTGMSLGYSDFGNNEFVGQSYTLQPFVEFNLFPKKTKKLSLLIGFGASYFNTKYDSINNPFNRGISTDITMSFRSFLKYKVFASEKTDYSLGLGYFHHSNGHTKLPNQGLNSFLLSFTAQFNQQKVPLTKRKENIFNRSTYNYFSFRTGIGQNVLSEIFNDKKNVYTAALNYGKVINNTYKFGFGLYYRFYEHYYDYIKNNEQLVKDDYPIFKDNPFGYATNLGVFAKGELLLNHVGIEFQLGLNIYKPFYKIDWRLNQGYSFQNGIDGIGGETIVVEGELDWYYEVKRSISSRLGMNYYFIGTKKRPIHNWFVGAHINANLGQADFPEFSLGYVYSFR